MKKADKKKIIIAAAAVVLSLAVALAVYGVYHIRLYSLAVEAICEGDLASAEDYLDRIPSGFRDIETVRNFAAILEAFDEKDRDSYGAVMDKLDSVRDLRDRRLLSFYISFRDKVDDLEDSYRDDRSAADSLMTAIDDISPAGDASDISLEQENMIHKTVERYESSRESVRELVDNADVLFLALERVQKLREYKNQAENVDALILAIGAVTLEKSEQILQTQSAYDSLSDEAKAFVQNYDALAMAQHNLQTLENDRDHSVYYTTSYYGSGSATSSVQPTTGSTTSRSYSGNTTATTHSATSAYSGAAVVYWVPNGEVYHITRSCRTLARSKEICSGPVPSGRRPCKVCS